MYRTKTDEPRQTNHFTPCVKLIHCGIATGRFNHSNLRDTGVGHGFNLILSRSTSQKWDPQPNNIKDSRTCTAPPVPQTPSHEELFIKNRHLTRQLRERRSIRLHYDQLGDSYPGRQTCTCPCSARRSLSSKQIQNRQLHADDLYVSLALHGGPSVSSMETRRTIYLS